MPGTGRGVASWKSGTSGTGTCPAVCTDTGTMNRSFTIDALQDEFSGFDSFVAPCLGSDYLTCPLDTSASRTVPVRFIAHPGSPTATSVKDLTSITNVEALEGEPAADGGYYLAGSISGAVDLGGGALPTDPPLLARFDAAGAHVWSKKFTGNGSSKLYALAVAPDGTVAVAGRCSSGTKFSASATALTTTGPCVARLDADGNLLWAKGWTATATINGVAVDAVGNVAIVGSATGALDLGTGPLAARGNGDYFYGVLSNTGTTRWAKRGGTTSSTDDGFATAFDPAGNVLFTGTHRGAGSLENLTFTSNGFNMSGFIVHYAVDGTYLNGRAFTPTGLFTPARLRVAPDGSIFLGGNLQGSVNFGTFTLDTTSTIIGWGFVAKFDNSVTAKWANAGNADLVDFTLADNGTLAVSFSFYRYAEFGQGYLLSDSSGRSSGLAKMNPVGDWIWSKRIGPGYPRGIFVSDAKLRMTAVGTPKVAGSSGANGTYLISYPR